MEMKKIVSQLLAILLMVNLCTYAVADEVNYASTQAITQFFDVMGKKYLYEVDDDGDEVVSIMYGIGDEEEVLMQLFFPKDERHCYLYVSKIVTFADESFSEIVHAVNQINSEYRYCTFYALGAKNIVRVSATMVFQPEDACEVVLEYMLAVGQIIEDVYPSLAVYAAE